MLGTIWFTYRYERITSNTSIIGIGCTTVLIVSLYYLFFIIILLIVHSIIFTNFWRKIKLWMWLIRKCYIDYKYTQAVNLSSVLPKDCHELSPGLWYCWMLKELQTIFVHVKTSKLIFFKPIRRLFNSKPSGHFDYPYVYIFVNVTLTWIGLFNNRSDISFIRILIADCKSSLLLMLCFLFALVIYVLTIQYILMLMTLKCP